MSISFRSGKPIARIVNKGSKNHGRIVYIRDTISETPEQQVKNKLDKLDNSFFKKFKLKAQELNQLRKAIKDNIEPTDENLKEIYDKAQKKINTSLLTELTLKGGKLQPLPSNKPDRIERIYISAPSGAGKSTFASNWIREYKKNFKDNEFYIFSNVGQDKPLDKLDPIRIGIDADLIDDPLEPEELEDSLVLFDDCEVIANKYLRNWVTNFQDQLLQEGRHWRTNVVVTSHVLMNYKATMRVINEATSIIVFPRAGSTYQIKRLLKEYIGLDKHQIKKFLNSPSRWVMITKTCPVHVIHEKGAYIANQEDFED